MTTLYQLHFILDGKDYAFRGSQSQVPRIEDHVVLNGPACYRVTGVSWRFDIDRDGPTRVPVEVFIERTTYERF